MIAKDKVGAGLRGLLDRLVTYEVIWNFADLFNEAEYEIGADRHEAPIDRANVASSYLREHHLKPKTKTEVEDFLFDEDLLEEPRHVIALDLDIPAHLVSSHTEGHSHLYIDVPGGIAHDDYMELLGLLGRIGVIEKGYAEVSIKRGHTDLRLPWVAKEPRPERPVEMATLPQPAGPGSRSVTDFF